MKFGETDGLLIISLLVLLRICFIVGVNENFILIIITLKIFIYMCWYKTKAYKSVICTYHSYLKITARHVTKTNNMVVIVLFKIYNKD